MSREYVRKSHDSQPQAMADDERIQRLRHKLNDDVYMAEAVARLAQELTVELMEDNYGVSFH